MKTTHIPISLLAVAAGLAIAQSAQAGIAHRYSFNQSPGATTVLDSIGGANGVLKGNVPTLGDFDGAGQLWLLGGSNSDAAADVISGYVDLPNGIISALHNATFETWTTWMQDPAVSGVWQRPWDFGTSAAGEDVSNGNGDYLFLSVQANPATIRFAVRDPGTQTERVVDNAPGIMPREVEVCLTVTYDVDANVSRVFSNGVMVASGTAVTPLETIHDVNNWLGRSQWGDQMYHGNYNEFRIYNNALDPISAAASYFGGTETPSTNVANLGALQAVNLTAAQSSMTVGDTQPTVATADFAKITGISLAGISGVTYGSSNPGVLTVETNGVITAVGQGVANATINYLTRSDSVTITVNPRLQGVVVAGSLVVDLRATDLSGGIATWVNQAGTGDFTAAGTPEYNANVASGVAGVTFNGTNASYAGPLPSAEISGNSDRSIEVWAFQPTVAQDETMVSWGHRDTTRENMAFGYGANANWGAAGLFNDDLGWAGTPVPGQWHYLVFTYNGLGGAKVYADGKVRTAKTLGGSLATPEIYPILIGAQNTGAGALDMGQALSGTLARVRVHTGILSDLDVANNFLYGVEMTDPGTLQSITLSLTSTNLPPTQNSATAVAVATFANRNYLVVNEFSTFTSSDTNVATVSTNGYIAVVNPGTTVITASYQGMTGSQTLTVQAPPATELKHRYSFSETGAPGTPVADSVGTATAQFMGTTGELSGGKLSVPPPTTASNADAASIAGYVDLPNGIVSSLTSVSFEAWVTWDGTGNWQRIFDIGSSAGGEDIPTSGNYYFFLNTNPFRFVVRDAAANAEIITLNGPTLATNTEYYLAVTYDTFKNVSRLYTNGVLLASGAASMPLSQLDDVNCWLGRSQYGGDTVFAGRYNEFRIWEGALTAEAVAAAYAAGPDALPVVNPPALVITESAGGSLVVSWPASATGFGLWQSAALGTAANWTTVDTSGAVEQDGQKVLTLPNTGGTAVFYQLRK